MQYGMHTHASGCEWTHEILSCVDKLSSISRRYLSSLIPLIFACLALFSQTSFAAVTPGAIPGTFSVNESGAATYNIPLTIAPGTGGMQPTLSLQYNSQGGNGLLGMGWSLGGLSAISRCPQTQATDGVRGSVNFDANDRFCLDGQRLIVVSGSYGADGAEYRTELESFSRIISYGTAGNGPASFKVWTKSGQVMEYGVTNDARIEAQGKSSVAVWALNKVQDTVGNYFTISYTEDNANGQYYPARIDYTGNANTGLTPYNSVQFVYETRPDITPTYHAGSLIVNTVRLKSVQNYADIVLVKDYRLAYGTSVATNRSRLIGLTECAGDEVCLPSTNFGWQEGGSGGGQQNIATMGFNGGPGYANQGTRAYTDVNGDGKADFCRLEGPGGDGNYYILCTTNLGSGGDQQNIATTGFNGGPGYDNPETRAFTDVNGDGKADFCRLEGPGGDGNYYILCTMNLGSGGAQQNIATTGFNGGPGYANPGTRAFVDVNGDGKADFCRLEGPGGDGNYYILCTTNLGSGGAQQNIATMGFNGGPGYANQGTRAYTDVNGDGKADFCRLEGPGGDGNYYILCTTNLGSGGDQQNIATTGFNGGPGYDNPETRAFTDVNGDGKADFCRLEGPGGDGNYYILCTMNLGSGGAQQNIATTGFNGGPGYANPRTRAFVDVNGDGKADFCRLEGPGGDGNYYFLCSTNLSSGGAQQNIASTGFNGGPGYANPGSRTFTDVNGDGKADFCRLEGPGGDGNYYILCTNLDGLPGTIPDYMAVISDGLGITNSIIYKPLTDNSVYTKDTHSTYPTVDIQAPIYVVSSSSTSDGVGGSYQMNYSYGGMKASQDGRGMLGFRTVTAYDPKTGIVSRTEYRQDYPYTGMPVLSTTTSASGIELNRTENTYAEKVIPGGGKFPYLAYSKSQGKDLNGIALPYTETWNETFDDWGNATKITVITSDGFTTGTNNTYTNDATKWLLGRLTRAAVTKSIVGGPAQTRTSAFAYNGTTGLLTQETIEPDQPTLRLITDYVYDAYGNKTQVTVSGGDASTGTSFTSRTTSITHDSKGRFPLTTTNALGHTETRVFDERFGLVKSLTGPNGLTTTWAYDGFGRKTLESRADGTQTTWSFADCVNACGFVKYTTTVTSSGAPPAITHYDALRRPVRTVTTGFDGQAIYADTEYDNHGRVKRTSRPYFANAPVYWTTSTYDELGRTTRVDAPDGTFSTMAYNGLSSVSTNPKGQTKTELKNSQGQTVSVTDNAGGVTSYKFDALGNLIETRPPGGGLLAMSYDLRGRKVSSSDPDMGYWTYSYNALGELIRQTDAKNQVTTMTYDLLGRIKTRVEPDMTSTWTYDTAAKGIGKLASVTGGGVSKTFTYDALGRPIRAATVVDGITFNQDSSYDSLGRILTQTRPSGFVTKNIYNANGYQSELRNADASNALLWKAVTVDAEGRITQTQYGNGVVNTRTYQAQNGLLTSIQANAPNTGVALQNQSFTYDSLGNLTSRADPLTSGGLSETFQYDNLNRLTQSALTQGGIAQTPVALTYDATGNITSKTGVGIYTYHATKIHAVVQAGNNTYTYDANGNLTGGAGRAVTWTSWNMPASDSYGGATTSWTYDAEHVRIKQVSGVKTTYYLNPRADLGGHYEEEHYSGGRVDKLHGLYAAGQYIGQITTTNQVQVATKTRYFHTDHLGSISVVTDEYGVVITRYSYDAWGKRQIVTGEGEDLHHGYTGHEHLDNGFVHMNGRLYDPVLGRFISADPYIQDASDGQGFNRYSYVNNNPLSLTDPSGYWSLKKFLKSQAKFHAFPTPKNTFNAIRSQPGQEQVDRYVLTHQWAYAVGQIAIGAATWICGGCGAAAFSAYYSYAATGSGNAAFKAAIITYATSVAFSFAGDIGAAYGDVAGVVAHAVVGCASAAASGGQCGAGALSAGFSKLGSIAFDGYDAGIGGLIASSVIGGTASVLGGGKFANGAITGAFGYLYNECVHRSCFGRNPAQSVANNALKDRRLSLSEANEIWRANNDPNFELTVDASQLTVKQIGEFGPTGTARGRVVGPDWFVHGSVTLNRDLQGSISIRPGTYDFLPHGSFLSSPVRNFETYGGFWNASRAGTSVGIDFLINYSGRPNVTR